MQDFPLLTLVTYDASPIRIPRVRSCAFSGVYELENLSIGQMRNGLLEVDTVFSRFASRTFYARIHVSKANILDSGQYTQRQFLTSNVSI